jgi:hypothetical protein
VTLAEAWTLAFGAAVGIGSIVVYLLVLMIGLCLALDRTKFRPTRKSRTVKSLDETVGAPIVYLPANAPRGPSNQLAGSGYVAS